jgi:hypothetical protein
MKSCLIVATALLILAVSSFAQDYVPADDYQYAQDQDTLYHDYAARQELKTAPKP